MGDVEIADQPATTVEIWAGSTPQKRVALREVDRRVLLEHPRARQPTWWDHAARSSWLAIPALLAVFAPIGGMFALIARTGSSSGSEFNGFHPSVGVPLAGWCFIASSLFVVVVVIEWWRQGRRPGERPWGWLLLVGIPAGIAVPMVQQRLEETWVSGVWAVPVYVAVVLAASGMLVVLVAARRRPDDEPEAGSPRSARRRAHDRYWVPLDVDRLPEPERQQLLAIRERTLRILVSTGRLPESVAEHHASTALGEVALAADQKDTDGEQQ